MPTETSFHGISPARPAILTFFAMAFAIIMSAAFAGGTAAQGATPVVEGTPAVAENECDATSPGVGAEPWIRTELYFGTTIPNDGGDVSDAEWNAFLDEEITPRFPDGLTVLEGYGQFLNAQGVIAEEDSIVLIIFHPAEFIDDSSVAIEEIRDAYETAFQQESVLRVDSEPACVSF
ncbi:MAG: DUF3574 domain-containing protein [Thermomicrobiales bacterium]